VSPCSILADATPRLAGSDGRIELDTNIVERAIRPVALGRKNHPLAGSDGGGARWATVCSLITTAKLNESSPSPI
jgi:transposase